MEEIKKEKGCVYFFKHSGLNPIKIGYSKSESPLLRFNQFKSYAPYGAEIVGFIKTYEPARLEKMLHQKYMHKKMEGEWFNISVEDVENEILIHQLKDDEESKSNFYLAWAKHLDNGEAKRKQSIEYKLISENFVVPDNNSEQTFLCIDEIIDILEARSNINLSVQKISVALKDMGFVKSRKIIEDNYKRGFFVKLI